ncbi:MAG: ABC transporter substrate-binding protein [Caldilineaceae bacterium]|nr:ABC transporter substrate-binding protein [Caldilineaceae bacterium]
MNEKFYRLNRRRFLQLTGGTAALGLLAACAPAAAPTTGGESEGAAPADAAAGDAPTGGTMVWAGHHEISGLSPNDTGPTIQFAVITNIHDPMLNMTENLELEPYLAESYEVSDDGLEYTFHLREGIKFHDGTDFTAADVKYTFEFYSDVETGSTLANNFKGMSSVEAPDDYTIVITMSQPNAAFLVNAATTLIVSSAHHSAVGEEGYRTDPIGTGPFKLVEWVPAEYTLLEANEEYFLGRPKVDFLREEIIPEPSVRAIAMETGDVHYSAWPLLVEDSIRLRDSGEGFKVFETPASSVKHFPLNNDHPVLSDKNVRQAMMYGLDRQRIIDDLWNGAATVATSNLSPASSFYNPNVKEYPYDPDMAVQLLEEAGWVMGDDGVRVKDGVRCAFICATIIGDQARRPIAEFAQQQFQDLGIEMELQETAGASDGMRQGELNASLYNWTYGDVSDPDASTTLRSDGANNFSKFKNDRVDELLDLGLVETDQEKRKAYYAEIQEIVAEEVPFLFLQYDTWFDPFRPEVGGIPEPGTIKDGNRLMQKAYLMTLQS